MPVDRDEVDEVAVDLRPLRYVPPRWYERRVAELPADVLDQLRDKLAAAASLADLTERLLEVVATIDEALADLGVRPIVVGGLAMAHWSDSAFVTGDIDAIVPRRKELDARLVALGFERHGRQWKLPGHPVIFEAPAETLEPGDEAEPVTLASGRTVLVLSRVDLLLWRLREWVHWQSAAGFRQAGALLFGGGVDESRLEQRAAEEGLSETLRALRALGARIEAGESVENVELAQIARQLERRSYSGQDDV